MVNEAINAGVKISFEYFDYDNKKKHIIKNDGKPYTVSPYDLIWDGDYYYLTGFCDERDEVRTRGGEPASKNLHLKTCI